MGNTPGVAAFLDAARKNDVYEMSSLLDQFDREGLRADTPNPMMRTALHEAAAASNLVAVKFLLTRGSEPSPKDSWNMTPLDEAIKVNATDVQKLLVDSGAQLGNIELAIENLMTAVQEGNLELVKSLVESGTSVNSHDDDNRSTLHHAAAKGNLVIIEYLIGAGAYLDSIDNFGLTPLGEASRHGSRTGENRVRDKLVAAGANMELSGRFRMQTYMFGSILAVLQLLFIILFATCTTFSDQARHGHADSADALKKTYSMFMDVHVMIFIGFGFLMTFLRKYGHSSVGFNFLLAAITIQWHILCGGFFEMAFAGKFHAIEIGLSSLLLADFAAAVVLITYGALLGKVSPMQMVVLAFFEIAFFSLNEQILLKLGILDVGGSIVVHLFGAYFGLAASWILSAKSASSNENNASVYHSDLFAMIGTLFLWVYWPSFVASPAGEHDQERAIVATTLSLAGSCLAAFMTSLILRLGKFSMVDVQNATLAGGVAIGSAANLTVLSPAESLVIGVLGGET